MVEAQNISLRDVIRSYPQLLSLTVEDRRKYVNVCISVDEITYNLITEYSKNYNVTKSALIEKIIILWQNQNEIPIALSVFERGSRYNKQMSANIDIKLYNYIRVLKLNLSRMVRYTMREIVGESGRSIHQQGSQKPEPASFITEGEA